LRQKELSRASRPGERATASNTIPRQTKVRDAQIAVRIHQNIGGLEIAMDNFLAMQKPGGVADARRPCHRLSSSLSLLD